MFFSGSLMFISFFIWVKLPADPWQSITGTGIHCVGFVPHTKRSFSNDLSCRVLDSNLSGAINCKRKKRVKSWDDQFLIIIIFCINDSFSIITVIWINMNNWNLRLFCPGWTLIFRLLLWNAYSEEVLTVSAVWSREASLQQWGLAPPHTGQWFCPPVSDLGWETRERGWPGLGPVCARGNPAATIKHPITVRAVCHLGCSSWGAKRENKRTAQNVFGRDRKGGAPGGWGGGGGWGWVCVLVWKWIKSLRTGSRFIIAVH